VSEPVREALDQAIDESFVVGFRFVMLIACGLALTSALSAAVLIERQPAGQPGSAAATPPVAAASGAEV
jgi:hypothetical protein